MQTVPIPARLRQLPRDRRGLPIPVIILWVDDKPIFAANDQRMVQRCFNEDRCHICGGKLLRGRWFVSGAFSALSEHGAVMDGPMHDECAHYALKVCPYMAMPTYGRLVGKQQIAAAKPEGIITLPDPTDGLPRPEVFAAQMAIAPQELTQELIRAPTPGLLDSITLVNRVRIRAGSIRRMEFWRHGGQIRDHAEIRSIIAEVRAGLARDMAGGLRPDALRVLHEE